MFLRSNELNGSRVSVSSFCICGLNALLLDALLHNVKDLAHYLAVQFVCFCPFL